MSVSAILSPVLVMIGLTFVLLVWMGRSRIALLRSGEVKVKNIALGERVWPTKVQQVANAYHNQFEVPVLFYVLTALALVTRKADLAFVIMAWIFVASRLVHAYIFTTSNRVSWRFMAFLVGAVILMLMWILFAVRIYLSEVGVA